MCNIFISRGRLKSLKVSCFFTHIRRANAAYVESFNQELPWSVQPVFAKLLHEEGNTPALLKIDAFHAVSLGVGKNFAAGGLSIVQALCPGNSIEQRLVTLSADYLEFCKDPLLNRLLTVLGSSPSCYFQKPWNLYAWYT